MLLWILTACQSNTSLYCDTLLCSVEPSIEDAPYRLRKVPAGNDPQQRYTLDNALYVLIHEVTQRQYQTVMEHPAHHEVSPLSNVGPNYPAAYVSWHMAAAFSNQLTENFNENYQANWSLCYSCNNDECAPSMDPYECSGFRLPTDAEWEYLARSGSTKDFWTGAGPYQGGHSEEDVCSSELVIYDDASSPMLTDYAWYCFTNNTHPIGRKKPNGFGLYDMHGNVWEWTNDTIGCDFPESEVNPFCTDPTTDMVARGGAWSTFPYYLAASHRSIANIDRRDSSIGFRIVRSDVQPAE